MVNTYIDFQYGYDEDWKMYKRIIWIKLFDLIKIYNFLKLYIVKNWSHCWTNWTIQKLIILSKNVIMISQFFKFFFLLSEFVNFWHFPVGL